MSQRFRKLRSAAKREQMKTELKKQGWEIFSKELKSLNVSRAFVMLVTLTISNRRAAAVLMRLGIYNLCVGFITRSAMRRASLGSLKNTQRSKLT